MYQPPPAPDDWQPMIEATYALCAKLTQGAPSASPGGAVDYAAVEELVGQHLQYVERQAHQLSLAQLDVDAPYIRVWGETYRRVGRTPGRYRCLGGEIELERTVYRKMGSRKAETVDAVSLRSGAVADGWLPKTAQAMGHLIARGTSREAQQTSEELMRLPYSRSSFERIGHEVGAQYRRTAARVDQALIEAYEVPAEATSIAVSIDRVAVPMEEPVEQPEPGPWLFPEHEEQAKRLKPRFARSERSEAQLAEFRAEAAKHTPKVQRNWRMAYVATVTLNRPVEGKDRREEQTEALHTIRYGRMPKENIDALCRRLVADVRALRDKRPELQVALIADGAPEMWTLFDAHFDERQLGVCPTRLIDFWHVSEYLGKAANALEAAEASWPGTFRRWKGALLDEPEAAAAIVEELEASGVAETERGRDQKPVTDAIRYLKNRSDRLDYAGAVAAGLPVGSGSVESSCKSLVSCRMKRPGARWKDKSGAEVLSLRSLLLSDRWQPAMARALRPLRKAVQPISSFRRAEALAA
jgi:hypothetical protein